MVHLLMTRAVGVLVVDSEPSVASRVFSKDVWAKSEPIKDPLPFEEMLLSRSNYF